MTKWSQWSLIFIARCILKAATSCTQPKRNVKNRTENPFKLTLSLPFLGPRSVRSSFFLACPGLGLWFEPLGCCKRFVLRSTAIPMDSYGICCSNVFPYVNKCIYIYIIDIIYVCMQCWSHICIYIYAWPGGFSSWIWCVCWNCHKLYCFHKWYPKNPYKKERCWRSKSGEAFFVRNHHGWDLSNCSTCGDAATPAPCNSDAVSSGFLDSLLLAFLETVLTLRSICSVKWLCQKEHRNFKCQDML